LGRWGYDVHPSVVEQRTIELGRGGFGQVTRILCNGKILARKMTVLDANKPGLTCSNMSELKTVKLLSHQHLTQLCGMYTLGQGIYSLYYPVADMNLRKYMSLMKINDPNWARTLISGMGCLSDALAYTHDQGVKHQDIKPENILVWSGILILCDWGLASAFNARGGSFGGEILGGTRIYSAPEVLAGEKQGRASDVYSLGLVFEEMLDSVDEDVFTLDRRLGRPIPAPDGERIRQLNYINYGPEASRLVPNPEDTVTNMCTDSKQISRQDMRLVFGAMIAKKPETRPTARMLSDHFKEGEFDWVYQWGKGDLQEGDLFLKTCGQCCK